MAVQYKDYYKILGVSRDATEKDIKSAYRKLARKYHPDVDSSPGAADRFKDINEAYEVLGDAQKRAYYDGLGSWQHGTNFSPPPGFEGYASVNMEDLNSIFSEFGFGTGPSGGFSDFFEYIFGQMAAQPGTQFHYKTGGNAHPRANGGQKPNRRPFTATSVGSGLDVEQPIALDMEDAAKGGVQKKVTLAHSNKTVTVTIPKGVREGSKIRLTGEGRLGPNAQRGDAFLLVHFKKHPQFELENENLLHEAHVAVADLVLGGEITIPTLFGKVSLKIPEGTQPGRKMRLKGQGLPPKDSKTPATDLIVTLRAKIPEKPSEREKNLYRELRKVSAD